MSRTTDEIGIQIDSIRSAIEEMFGNDGHGGNAPKTPATNSEDRILKELIYLEETIRHITTGGGGGTLNHAALNNRDIADQHIINAITGLRDALNEKANSGDLGTAAAADVDAFASADEGKKANNALQPADLQDPASATASGKPADALATKVMVEGVADDVSDINALIPTQATPANKLVDKNLLNDTVASLAADYIEKDATGATMFTSLAEIVAGPWFNGGASIAPQKNDYAVYANATDGTWWAMFDGTIWANRFQVNTAPMTAAQVAALNSNITAALVALIPTAVQQSRTVAGIALTADIGAAALKAALTIMWADIGGKPTTVSGFGITDVYTMTQVNTAISAIVARVDLMVQVGETVSPPNPIPTGGMYIRYKEEM